MNAYKNQRCWNNVVMITLILVMSFSLQTTLFSQTPDFVWAQKGGGTEYDEGCDVAFDAMGNVCVTGYFENEATFGTTTFTSAGYQDIFVAKYSAAGDLLWVQQFGANKGDTGFGITTDSENNIIITGYFGSTVAFGDCTVTATTLAGFDIFLTKFDPEGNVLWAKSGGGDYVDYGFGVATDGSDNIIATGYFNGEAHFDSQSPQAFGDFDIYVSKWDPDGNLLWIKSAGGTGDDRGYGVISDHSGNSYITGCYENTAAFDGIELESEGESDVFVAKYDALGNALWARTGGGSLSDQGISIATDESGNCYATGFFSGFASFGEYEFTCTTANTNFILKYDASGALLWAEDFGDVNVYLGILGVDIAADAGGNSYVTGYFTGTAQFNGFEFNSDGRDLFIAKYSSSGIAQWVLQAGNNASETGNGIAINSEGEIAVTGYFQDDTQFNSTALTNAGKKDMFVTKWQEAEELLTVKISPEEQTLQAGQSCSFDVVVENVQNLGAFEFDLVYSTDVVHANSAELGPFLASTGRSAFTIGATIDNQGALGSINFNGISFSAQPPIPGPDGNGVLATIWFTAQADGETPLQFSSLQLTDINAQLLAIEAIYDGEITVGEKIMVDITFNVTVPPYTPEEDIVYLAGTFNDWDPGPGHSGESGQGVDLPMTKIGVNQWQTTLQLEPGEMIEYKYTRGSWNSVEDRPSNDLENRTLTIPGEDVTQYDVVTSWTDIPVPADGWGTQQSGVGARLYSVHAVTDQIGWAVGRSATILRTTDGGLNWQLIPAPVDTLDYFSVYSFDENTALVEGWANPPFIAYIFRTTNGGASWTQVYQQDGGFISNINMSNLNNGIAIGDPLDGVWTIIETSDGGLTWTPITNAPAQIDDEWGTPSAVNWVNNNICWFGTQYSRVYHTEDGGATWMDVAVPVLNSTTTLAFTPSGVGIAGRYGGQQIARTIDNGDNWEIIPTAIEDKTHLLYFHNDTFWFSQSTSLYSSSDNGDTWDFSYTSPANLRYCSFVDMPFGIYGWAVGDNGVILRYGPGATPVHMQHIDTQPDRFKLSQNYPNPFNPATTITFRLPEACAVSLTIYNVLGHEVEKLIEENRPAGVYSVLWDAADKPSGIYFLKLQAGETVLTKKMLLQK